MSKKWGMPALRHMHLGMDGIMRLPSGWKRARCRIGENSCYDRVLHFHGAILDIRLGFGILGGFVIITEAELSFWSEMELPNSSEVRAKAEERKHKRVQDQLHIKFTVKWKQYDSLPSVKQHQNQSI